MLGRQAQFTPYYVIYDGKSYGCTAVRARKIGEAWERVRLLHGKCGFWWLHDYDSRLCRVLAKAFLVSLVCWPRLKAEMVLRYAGLNIYAEVVY